MKYKLKEYPEIKNKVDNMDIEQLIKCVICPNIYLADAEVDSFPEYLRTDTPVQMVVKPSVEQGKDIKNFIDSQPEIKRLVCGDLECGAGKYIAGMSAFPSIMAMGQVGDEELAYQIGALAAKEGRMAGFHWTFAPCVDIVTNHDNPIVSTRGISDNVETVIEIGGAYMRGLQDCGMIATLKHFPGDGLCKYDQHLTTPENPLSMEEWYQSYGKVYRQLIEQGAKTIMPGHISLPAYDDVDEKTGVYPPATLSYKLLTKLLREELGFEGIIVSDAVNMSGFCGFMNYYDACCRFLEAGGDCLLFAHGTDDFIEEITKRIEKGQLHLDILKNRAYRMLCFAEEYYESRPEITGLERDNAERIVKQVVQQSMHIVRDRDHLIPFAIEEKTKILHVVVHNNYLTDDVQRLTEELRKLSTHVEEIVDPGPGYLREIVMNKAYDLIVCTVGCQPAFGLNSVRLHGKVAKNMMNGWTKFDTPVIFVNYGHPYLEEEYKAVIDTIINTYGTTEYTAKAVVELITGRRKERI